MESARIRPGRASTRAILVGAAATGLVAAGVGYLTVEPNRREPTFPPPRAPTSSAPALEPVEVSVRRPTPAHEQPAEEVVAPTEADPPPEIMSFDEALRHIRGLLDEESFVRGVLAARDRTEAPDLLVMNGSTARDVYACYTYGLASIYRLHQAWTPERIAAVAIDDVRQSLVMSDEKARWDIVFDALPELSDGIGSGEVTLGLRRTPEASADLEKAGNRVIFHHTDDTFKVVLGRSVWMVGVTLPRTRVPGALWAELERADAEVSERATRRSR